MKLRSALAILFALVANTLPAAEKCVFEPFKPDVGITMTASTEPSTFTLENPIAADDIAEALKANKLTFDATKLERKVTAACWQSADEAVNGKTCEDSLDLRDTEPLPLTVGYCKEKTASGKTTAVTVFPTLLADLDDFGQARGIVIRYAPGKADQTESYLRLEWQFVQTKEGKLTPEEVKTLPKRHRTYKVTAHAGVARFDDDERYKLWLYTGYTFASNQGDFKDSFAEVRIRLESRFIDELAAMKKYEPARYRHIVESGQRCGWRVDEFAAAAERARRMAEQRHEASIAAPNSETAKAEFDIAEDRLKRADAAVAREEARCGSLRNQPWFTIFRLYGELGLTSTQVVAATDDMNVVTNNARRTFDGTFGFGYGKTILVANSDPEATNSFSLLFPFVRIGMTSIPGRDADTTVTPNIPAVATKLAFKDFIGVHIENETGHFQGAYFEFGRGESEQYTAKRNNRMKVDGLLPINDPGGLFRVAARVQLDRIGPWSRVNHKKDNYDEARVGDIRISMLFNIDLKELSHRLGVTPPKGQ